ncbi:amidophosphoribosyltransferase [Pleomorphochaeta sp. DL1XJH-081]|uniref:amidophosphoribosyltransferase n=1 Tax=Pleomorphochaeta sp. DL1XJH-081 TaxID=3409690 RepID=UPI003BB62D39
MIQTGMREECGVFGIHHHHDAANMAFYGLHALQHRGQEACGIMAGEQGEYDIHKGPGLVHQVFTDNILQKLKGSIAIGHVRYSVTGGTHSHNIQPFIFNYRNKTFGLCHNGNIVNYRELKRDLEEHGSIFHSSSDSELIAHMMSRDVYDNPITSLKRVLVELVGAFAFIIMVNDELYAVRDKNGLRPLSIGKLDDSYVVASETCALDAVGATFIRDVEPGEIVRIHRYGISSDYFSEERTESLCTMEYIYFARPDSDMGGVNAHEFRKLSGKKLAQEHPVDADIVMGIPDSSLSAAIGYAEESHIPYEVGLIKNKYIGRTFIEPSKHLRDRAVLLKLAAIRKVVKGKRLVLIDDSIVRGTTLKRITRLLQDAGAKEIHVRIASPQITHPCFYGVDISNFAELVMAHTSKEALRDFYGVESLEFMSLDSLAQCTPNRHLCTGCFTGEYLTETFTRLEEASAQR